MPVVTSVARNWLAIVHRKYRLQDEMQIGSRLAGVFHSAVVLQDSPYERMTTDQWQICMKPKVHGAMTLRCATSAHQLEYIVCFSSVSSVFGGKGPCRRERHHHDCSLCGEDFDRIGNCH